MALQGIVNVDIKMGGFVVREITCKYLQTGTNKTAQTGHLYRAVFKKFTEQFSRNTLKPALLGAACRFNFWGKGN